MIGRTQVFTDGATNIIDGFNIDLGTTNFYVGSNMPNTRLIITNGGAVSGLDGYVGVDIPAANTQVFVSGSNSTWKSDRMFLGYGGSYNTVQISQGGKLNTDDSVFISYSSLATGNRILVSDAGSECNIGDLSVGFHGGSNAVLVSNGGAVSNGTTYLSVLSSGAGGNQAVIRNANSVWNGRGFHVGYWTGSNTLFVTNGGRLNSEFGTVGNLIGADRNRATVTGSNSMWSIGQLTIGQQGIGNQLLVSGGGAVTVTQMLVGGVSPAAFNRLVVDGGTIRATNATRTGELNIRYGTNVLNAGEIEADNLLLTNSAGRFEFNGGTLITRGGRIHNLPDFWMGASLGFPDATWDVRSNSAPTVVDANIDIGRVAPNTSLLITNGGTFVVTANPQIGYASTSTNNRVVVSGPGSRFNTSWFSLGNLGSGNLLVISNGAMLACSNNSGIGVQPVVGNNVAVVTGAGSLWTNTGLFVGTYGSGNELIVRDGGAVVANAVYIGTVPGTTNNRITVDNGTLINTNAGGTAQFEIYQGTSVLNAGFIATDKLWLTNAGSAFQFNGGMLNARAAFISNGAPFIVGSGSSPATYRMSGTTADIHTFQNGLRITNNASLAGNGIVRGQLTVNSGGTMAPGPSIGKIELRSQPILAGNIVLKISKNGATVTNDFVNVLAPLTYGGSLNVSNIGPTPLVLSNSFSLFNSLFFSGTFSSITLPPLPPGLNWTNRLVFNGSIMVVGNPVPGIGGVAQVGTNLILSVTNGAPGGTWKLLTATNVVAAIASWTTNQAGTFDALGGAVITNGVTAGEPKRYFRIKTP